MPAVKFVPLIILTSSLCACASLGAPGAVSPDRPGYTDTPPALPAHAVQLEAGATDDRFVAGAGQPRTDYITAGETLLRLGLGGRTEVRVFGNSYATRTTNGTEAMSGIEDAKVGVKTNIRAVADSVHSLLPNAAVLLQTTLATGGAGFTAGAAQPEAKLAADWTTPSPYSLYANVGYGAVQTATGRATHAWTSVANWWAVNPRVSVFAEALVIRRMSGDATPANDIDGGITYLINDRLQIDLRVGRAVGSETGRERFIGAGFARRW